MTMTTSDPTDAERAANARVLYKALVERSPDLICLTDLDGTILFASDAAFDLVGSPPAELVGRPVGTIAEADALERGFDALTKALAGEVVVERIDLVHKDGSVVPTETSMAIVKDAADAPIVLTTSRLATRGHAVTSSDRATERMATIGQMTGAIAHDFNNLLLPMLGFAQLALTQVRDDQPKLRHHVENIQDAAEKSRDLISRLLHLGGPETGVALISLDDVVESALPLLHMLLGADVDLEHVPTPGLPPCSADPTRISQLLMNLAANSRDALPPVGAVVRISSAHDGGAVTLTFADNGSGMDAPTRDRAFEPYFTTKGDRGTGLGLATVSRIVRECGGTVEVESAPGEGARFVISLPAS